MNARLAHSMDYWQAEHRALDIRLRRLNKRPFLTAAEQLEVAELKKRKLRAKEAMVALAESKT